MRWRNKAALFVLILATSLVAVPVSTSLIQPKVILAFEALFPSSSTQLLRHQDSPTIPATSAAREDWRMALYDVVASGHNRWERRLSSNNVNQLVVKWVFDQQDAGHEVGPIHATPVVRGKRVYVGASTGRFYAIDDQGKPEWEFITAPPNPLLEAAVITPVGGAAAGVVGTPIISAAVLPDNYPYVIFADTDGNVYALEQETGKEIWRVPQLDPHPLGGAFGNSLLVVDDIVVIGFSSVENLAFLIPDYECCRHKGLVVALSVATGKELWRYETIATADIKLLPKGLHPFKWGPSGADIWGQPTYDRQLNTIFIGTGQNFSPNEFNSSSDTSDALIALDASIGKVKWIQQLDAGDIWVAGVPNPDPVTGEFLDADIGDAPKIYRLPSGRKVIGVGRKSGEYHVIDAKTGEVISQTRYLKPANELGGFQQGGAFAGSMVYQHGLDGLGTGGLLGTVMALSGDGTEQFWRFDIPNSPIAGGLAVANGVVYFQSPVEEENIGTSPFQWAVYALDASTGTVLNRIPFEGRALSSPAISQGRIYFGFGNAALAEIGEDLTGGLVCLSLP